MSFDYSEIPEGYYDEILHGPDGVRKFWHFHKFETVREFIPQKLKGSDKAILDIGCFAGSFLGMLGPEEFGRQVGVDILPSQIAYAQKKYGTSYREFQTMDLGKLALTEKFDVITLIEVIEHLQTKDIEVLFGQIMKCLRPNGVLILTTPNYLSFWPAIEVLVNRLSSVKYEEQHLTKFNYFNFQNKLQKIFGPLSLRQEQKTTTHFLTPFIAGFNYELAKKMAGAIPSHAWKNPLGNLILSRWSKTD